jgi:hypothetical protein
MAAWVLVPLEWMVFGVPRQLESASELLPERRASAVNPAEQLAG